MIARRASSLAIPTVSGALLRETAAALTAPSSVKASTAELTSVPSARATTSMIGRPYVRAKA